MSKRLLDAIDREYRVLAACNYGFPLILDPGVRGYPLWKQLDQLAQLGVNFTPPGLKIPPGIKGQASSRRSQEVLVTGFRANVSKRSILRRVRHSLQRQVALDPGFDYAGAALPESRLAEIDVETRRQVGGRRLTRTA